jgi:hypothetical protein
MYKSFLLIHFKRAVYLINFLVHKWDRFGNKQSIQAEVSITNENPEIARFYYGACPLKLNLYADEERTEFVQSWWPGEPSPYPVVCPDILYVSDIEQDGVLEAGPFKGTFHLGRLELDGLQSGTYYLNVSLEHNWKPYEFPVGSIEVW